MAQAFVTTYNNIYRWHDIKKQHSLKPVDKLAETLPDGDIWIIPKKIGGDDEEGRENLAAAEAAIRKMYRKRLWTTYQVDYCADMLPKREVKEGEGTESFDSALLSYCRALYEPKKKLIPPPIPNSRRTYGYIRPTNMYVPLSSYQNDYGRVAYQVLDSNSRAKPQTAEVQIENIGKKSTQEGNQTDNSSPNQLQKNDGLPKDIQNKNLKAKKINNTISNAQECKCKSH